MSSGFPLMSGRLPRRTRALASALIAGALCMSATPLRAAPACSASTPAARNFVLRDVDNHKWTFASTKGKVVLLDFWATWCAPCKIEIPGFVEMYDRYKADGFEVVGVSMDTDLPGIKAFAGEHRINYPILIGAGADGVSRAFDVEGLPTTVLVTRDGRICRTFVGETSKAQFEDVITQLLAAPR